MESVVNLPSVPTSLFMNSWPLRTFMENRPKARRRTMASSLSRKIMGSLVPHFISVKVFLLTK